MKPSINQLGFSVTLLGDPPSVNHMYRVTRKTLPTGGQRAFMAKTDAARKYTDDVAIVVRSARPSAFQPKGYIYIVFDFMMKRGKDTDNVQKALNDGIAAGLGINDKWFLPIVNSKTTGSKEPKTHVTLLDATYWDMRPVEK